MLVDVNLADAPIEIPRTTPIKEMISVGQKDGKTLVRINSSSLAILLECQRKAQLSLRERWIAETESPATVFGTAIHKALEIFYSGNPAERVLPKLEDMEMMGYGHKVEGEEKSILLQAARAFIEKCQPIAALPEQDKRSIQTGLWSLHHYFKTYLNDPYVAYVDQDGPFVERSFSFRLHEDEKLAIDYFGTIDLVVRHATSGDIVVCDHKTSSTVGNDFYNRLKPNHQYTGYIMAAQQVFGLETNDFLVNCFQVKEKPKTSRGTPPHFPRQITSRDEGDFMEFRQTVVEAVHRYLRSIETGFWPLGHVNSCAAYGGCQFLAVCSAPISLRQNILTAKYVMKGTR